MQGQVGGTPGSPGEQRRKEKLILQSLNERLETVLVNIRRDNVKLSRNIRGHDDIMKNNDAAIAIINEEQGHLEKDMDDIHSRHSVMIASKLNNALAKAGMSNSQIKSFLLLTPNAALEEDFTKIGNIGQWDQSVDPNSEDTGAKYIELSTLVAKKELEVMNASAEKSYQVLKALLCS